MGRTLRVYRKEDDSDRGRNKVQWEADFQKQQDERDAKDREEQQEREERERERQKARDQQGNTS